MVSLHVKYMALKGEKLVKVILLLSQRYLLNIKIKSDQGETTIGFSNWNKFNPRVYYLYTRYY